MVHCSKLELSEVSAKLKHFWQQQAPACDPTPPRNSGTTPVIQANK